jgi:rhodanese-related sulfurtransferase
MPGYDEEEAFPYKTIGTDEAKQMIEAGTRVIDVRQLDEWNRGHIAEATLVPIEGIYSFGKALKELHLPPGEAVIFVCASGQRSASASEIALVVGLNNVYNLANGMNGWMMRRYPVER